MKPGKGRGRVLKETLGQLLASSVDPWKFWGSLIRQNCASRRQTDGRSGDPLSPSRGFSTPHLCSVGHADRNNSLPADAAHAVLFPASPPSSPPASALPLPPWPLSYIFSLSTFTVVSYPASSDDSTPASSFLPELYIINGKSNILEGKQKKNNP